LDAEQRNEDMADDLTPAMQEGRAAKLAGKTVSANPYRAGSQESADWMAGYVHNEEQQNVNQPEGEEG
jgi:hypothetical protein